MLEYFVHDHTIEGPIVLRDPLDIEVAIDDLQLELVGYRGKIF
jgi:hypothetical protein